MKSTGVVRKIDDLGRIVIPKEIRRNLRIRDGENLEIFIENESILLRKISKMENFQDITESICELVHANFNLNIALTDREKVISVRGETLENVKGSILDKSLINLIDNRESMTNEGLENIKFGSQELLSGYFVIQPIITSLDSLGLVILYSEIPLGKDIHKLGRLISNIISQSVDVDN